MTKLEFCEIVYIIRISEEPKAGDKDNLPSEPRFVEASKDESPPLVEFLTDG